MRLLVGLPRHDKLVIKLLRQACEKLPGGGKKKKKEKKKADADT